MNFHERLASCANDRERAIVCLALHEDARGRYIQGQSESIAVEVEHWERLHRKNLQPGSALRAEVASVARSRWAKHDAAKHLVGDEQFFCRLAMLYAAMVPMRSQDG